MERMARFLTLWLLSAICMALISVPVKADVSIILANNILNYCTDRPQRPRPLTFVISPITFLPYFLSIPS